jgi:hypothetical protein
MGELRELIQFRIYQSGFDSGKKKTNSTFQKTRYANPDRQVTPKSNRTRKGNPQRKSQWENNPSYKEYRRLEKIVQQLAKEQNCSFNSVASPIFGEYQLALKAWLDEKRTFRGSNPPSKDNNSKVSADKAETGINSQAEPSSKRRRPATNSGELDKKTSVEGLPMETS